MSKKNDDFFEKKKEWSFIKDELLRCYLGPYIQKIIMTRCPIVYIDGFAGRGVFDDGNPGSPLIAMDTILERYRMSNAVIRPELGCFFIENKYAKELKWNLRNYVDAKVINGNYEHNIAKLLSKTEGCNVFLYIDPFGIKALDFATFKMIPNVEMNSFEVLLNLNTFGFLRECLRVRQIAVESGDSIAFKDLDVGTHMPESYDESIAMLDRVAGGHYWVDIVEAYKDQRMTIYEAEAAFAEQYCNNLRSIFRYVLNMPIKTKANNLPKYRMIHATNHIDGCLLMVDNMYNRLELLKSIQENGQISLFKVDLNNNLIDMNVVVKLVAQLLMRYNDSVHLNQFLGDFYCMYGPLCKTTDIKNILKDMEANDAIDIVRVPANTEKTGRRTRFMDEKMGHKVFLRWIDQ